MHFLVGPVFSSRLSFPICSNSLMACHMSLGDSAAAFISPKGIQRFGCWVLLFFLLRAKGNGLLIVGFVELNT